MSHRIGFQTRSLLAGGFLLSALWACGADTTCGSLTEPLVVAKVDLAPTTLLLRRGQTRQFRAIPLTSCSNPVVDAPVTWSSADQTIASVSPTGLVTALSPGTTSITAQSEGKSAVAALSVTPVPVAQVTVSPSPAQVEQGLTLSLSATVTDSAGDVMPNQPVVWTSNNPSIASVDRSGVVSGVAPGGPVTISASVDTVAGEALVTVVRPPPTALVFSVDPADVIAGEEIAPAVEVTVADRFGTPVVGDTSSITLAIGANPGGASLGGVRTVKAVNGLATFSDLTLDRTGSGYTLTASATGLSTVASAAFAVTHATPAAIAYSVEPSDAVAGADMSPAVTISVLDRFGNLATSDTASVSIALGQNPGGGTLGGATLVAPVSGVATFSDLWLDKAGAGYTLVASRTGLASATSGSFTILPAAPRALDFTVEPSDATAGVAIAPAIELTVLDAFGNVVDTDASTIRLALGANPGGSTLGGTPTSTAVGGVARFTDIWLDRSGNGYTLVASRTGLPDVTSNSFAVSAGPPVALAYLVQPNSTAAGAPIAPPVQVGVVDTFDNVVTSSSATVDIGLANNPGGSALSGTTKVDAVQGIATFSDLSLNKTGSGYTLRATSPGLASVTSQGFDVTPGQPVRLVFTVQPTDTDPFAIISPPVEVSVLDAFDNVVTSSTVTINIGLALKPGGATLSGTTARSAMNGVAVFDDLSLDKSGDNYLLSASTPGLIGALSTFFDVP